MNHRAILGLARLSGRWWLAAIVAAALPSMAVGQMETYFEGKRPEAAFLEGADPASQWVGQPRADEATCDEESVYPGGFFASLCRHGPLGRWLAGPKPPAPKRESWVHRPLSVTWYLGGMAGSPMIDDWIRAEGGAYGGVRLGWDFDDYWGTEFQLGVTSLKLIDSQRAIDARNWYDTLDGYAPNDPYRLRYDRGRDADLTVFTLSALYYPMGDTPLRPYFSVGLGGTRLSFMDRLGESYDETLLTMPLGMGVKYHWTDWLALRFEICDNFAFGAGHLVTQHNVSFVGAAEIRLGGSRRSYWPWVPGRRSW